MYTHVDIQCVLHLHYVNVNVVLSEFEGYYWAELKNRLKQKRQDNIKLVNNNYI